MQRRDAIRIRHMLDAAREAVSLVEGKRRDDLNRERTLVLALVKLIEIVGEAASKVSPDARSEASQIPWQAIVAMRNRLIHGYFDINLDIVWDTVTSELPSLITALDKLRVDKSP